MPDPIDDLKRLHRTIRENVGQVYVDVRNDPYGSGVDVYADGRNGSFHYSQHENYSGYRELDYRGNGGYGGGYYGGHDGGYRRYDPVQDAIDSELRYGQALQRKQFRQQQLDGLDALQRSNDAQEFNLEWRAVGEAAGVDFVRWNNNKWVNWEQNRAAAEEAFRSGHVDQAYAMLHKYADRNAPGYYQSAPPPDMPPPREYDDRRRDVQRDNPVSDLSNAFDHLEGEIEFKSVAERRMFREDAQKAVVELQQGRPQIAYQTFYDMGGQAVDFPHGRVPQMFRDIVAAEENKGAAPQQPDVLEPSSQGRTDTTVKPREASAPSAPPPSFMDEHLSSSVPSQSSERTAESPRKPAGNRYDEFGAGEDQVYRLQKTAAALDPAYREMLGNYPDRNTGEINGCDGVPGKCTNQLRDTLRERYNLPNATPQELTAKMTEELAHRKQPELSQERGDQGQTVTAETQTVAAAGHTRDRGNETARG